MDDCMDGVNGCHLDASDDMLTSCEKQGCFEWIVDWYHLASYLTPSALRLVGSIHALDIGCGTSDLAVHLSHQVGVESVMAVDRDAACIEHMRLRHGGTHAVRWSTYDLFAADAASQIATAFELVIDKGTLDCALVEGRAAQLLCTVHQLLVAGGCYAVVSFRSWELLRRLLSCEAFGWDAIEYHHLPSPVYYQGDPGLLCITHKGFIGPHGLLIDVKEVEQHVSHVMDWWYQQEVPFLTAERERQIRTAWAVRQGAHGVHTSLPLRFAFETLFSPLERTELHYEDFVDDLLGFCSKAGHVAPSIEHTGLTLAMALDFLRATQ
mmetsp:Transcript_10334/g.17335  ORF Transcript_10334/g.17335 Transcript_10334/m.17335 type:complete len:323 (-) Transcript_10334:250-1218(-)